MPNRICADCRVVNGHSPTCSMRRYLVVPVLLSAIALGACAPGNARRQYQASAEQYRACLQTTGDCERQRRIMAIDERAYRNVEGRGYTISSED